MLLRAFPIQLALLVGSACFLHAGEGDAGHGSFEFGLGFYSNSDGSNGEDGNPFLDEELTVVEPVILFDHYLSDDTALFGKVSYDYVSSASIDRLSKFPAQSGASGDYYVGLELGARKETSETETWAGRGHVSAEYDYLSLGLGGDYARELPDQNASYSASLNGFYDTIDIIRYNGEEEGTDSRMTVSGSFNWYQIINPLLHGEAGTVLTYQNGFLETAYNAVVIEDTDVPNPNLVNNAPGREITEELEDTRIRWAGYGKLRRSLNDTHALELGGRLYADSWGITSVSIEPALYSWVIPDDLRLRLRYRFYTQTAADDYSESFTSETDFRTQDSDLADFNANTVGLMFTQYLDSGSEWDLGVDYVLRSDGLDQILGRVAYRRTY